MSHHESHTSENNATSNPSVLVIEAQRPIRQYLRTALVKNGYRVIEVRTGTAAIRHARSHAPDIVILDLELADIDGIEVIRQIRETSEVPIIVTSATNRAQGGLVAVNAGANDYVREPCNLSGLLHRIRALIEESRRQQNSDSRRPLVKKRRLASPNKTSVFDQIWLASLIGN